MIDMIELLGDGDDAFTTSVVSHLRVRPRTVRWFGRRTLTRAGVRNRSCSAICAPTSNTSLLSTVLGFLAVSTV